ncbi:hypothetical protein LV779_28110 [Streptomyces thinghirensis]|nr:hypothetical protein [Streptomyces thinghirensis]
MPRDRGRRRGRGGRESSSLTFASGAKARCRLSRHLRQPHRNGPRTYTTEAGKTIADTWNSAYSDGSLRPDRARTQRLPARLPGPPTGTAGPRGHRPALGDDDVRLTLTNTKSGTVRAPSRTPTARRWQGPSPCEAPAPPSTTAVDLARSRRWHDDGHLRGRPGAPRGRLAGRTENGRSRGERPGDDHGLTARADRPGCAA